MCVAQLEMELTNTLQQQATVVSTRLENGASGDRRTDTKQKERPKALLPIS